MAEISFYKIHNFVIQTEIPLLGVQKLPKAPSKVNIFIQATSKKLKKPFINLHPLPGVDCFQRNQNFYIRFHRHRSPSEQSYILTHDVLAMILASVGVFIFHGSLIQNQRGSFLILGKSGAGKSSLGLKAIEKKGHCWGDEASIIYQRKNRWFIKPAFSTLRFWPKPSDKSVHRVFGKELVVLSRQKRPQNLAKVIILQKKSKNSKLRTFESSGLEAVEELMTHLFWPQNLSPEVRVALFRQLTRLSENISPLIVEYPHRKQSQTLVLSKLLEFKKVS